MSQFTDYKYSIGSLENPKIDDKGFGSKAKATQAAIKAESDGHPWGVWDNDSSELLAIVYEGRIFT